MQLAIDTIGYIWYHSFLPMTEGEARLRNPGVNPTRWEGFGLPDDKLPGFLRQQYRQIRDAWQTEFDEQSQNPLTLDSYIRIIDKVGYYTMNVLLLARDWVRVGSIDEFEGEKEIGRTILTQSALNSIVNTIDRMKRANPNIPVVWEEVVARSLERTQDLIQKGWYPSENPRRRIINQYTAIEADMEIDRQTPRKLPEQDTAALMEDIIETKVDLENLIGQVKITFTENQERVYDLWADGYNAVEIAVALGKKTGEIDHYLQRIFEKIRKADNALEKSQLVKELLKKGWGAGTIAKSLGISQTSVYLIYYSLRGSGKIKPQDALGIQSVADFPNERI